MPNIEIPRAHINEEMRLMAETIQETGRMLDLMAKNPQILPGEYAGDFTRLWNQDHDGPKQELGKLVSDLVKPLTNPGQVSPISEGTLRDGGLIGQSAKFKREFVKGQRDEALRYLKPDKDDIINPTWVKPKYLRLGLEALGEYFEGMATLVKSLFPSTSSIVEVLSFAKQLCKAGAKWVTGADSWSAVFQLRRE